MANLKLNTYDSVLAGLGAAKMGRRFSCGVLDLTYDNLSKGEDSKSSQSNPLCSILDLLLF